VAKKKFDHCGKCDELPCERFTRFGDPSVSGENAARTLESMVARLKEMELSGE